MRKKNIPRNNFLKQLVKHKREMRLYSLNLESSRLKLRINASAGHHVVNSTPIVEMQKQYFAEREIVRETIRKEFPHLLRRRK